MTRPLYMIVKTVKCFLGALHYSLQPSHESKEDKVNMLS